MLDAIRRFFADRIARPPEGGAPTDREAGPPGIQLAACALLLEVAHADGEFTPAEQRHIEQALIRHFGLDLETARELIELANAERQLSVDDFQFTRLITEHYDVGQRMLLAELMWGVILADGTIGRHESYLIRKLGSLLSLEPAYLASARRAAGGE